MASGTETPDTCPFCHSTDVIQIDSTGCSEGFRRMECQECYLQFTTCDED